MTSVTEEAGQSVRREARVKVVRLSLDQRDGGYWNEIDAVELVGHP